MLQGLSLENVFKKFRKRNNNITEYCNFHNAAFDSWATGQVLIDFSHLYEANLLEDTRIRNKIFGYNPVCETVLEVKHQSCKTLNNKFYVEEIKLTVCNNYENSLKIQ